MSIKSRIPSKVRVGTDVKADHHNNIVDVLHAIDSELKSVTLKSSPTIGANVGPGGTTAYAKVRSRGGGGDKRFALSLDVEKQKLRIGMGFAVGKPKNLSPDDDRDSYEAQLYEPKEPKVAGIKLSKSDGISIASLATGKTYGVYCIANDSVPTIQIKEKATYYPKARESAFLIGTFKLKSEDGKKVLDGKINQLWLSDISMTGEGVNGESDESDESDDSDNDSDDSDDSAEFDSSNDLSVEDSGSSGSDDSEMEDSDCSGVWADLDLDPATLANCYAFRETGFGGTSNQVLPMRLRTEIAAKNDLSVCGGWRAKITVTGAKPAGSLGAYDVVGDSLFVDVPIGKQVRRFDFMFVNTMPCAVHEWTVEIRSKAQPPAGEFDPPGRSPCCGKSYIARSEVDGRKSLKLPRRCGSSYCSTPG